MRSSWSGGGRARWAAAGLWLAALSLAACFGAAAPRDHFYRPAKPSPAAPLTSPVLHGVLKVERLRADALTRERSILHVDSKGSVEVTPYAYQLWIDTPTILVQRDLAEYLRQAGVAERVVLPQANVSDDFQLDGWIQQLVQVTEGDHVVVEIDFSLKRRGGEQLLSKRYRAEQAVEGSAVDDVVRAFSEALGRIYARLVADIAASAG